MSGNLIPPLDDIPEGGRGYQKFDLNGLKTEANGTNGYELARRMVKGDGNSDGLDSVIKSQYPNIDADVVGVELVVESPSSSGSPFNNVSGPVGLDILWFTAYTGPHYLLFAKKTLLPAHVPNDVSWAPVNWSDDVNLDHLASDTAKDLPGKQTPGAIFSANYTYRTSPPGAPPQLTPEMWMQALGNLAKGVLLTNGPKICTGESGLIVNTDHWKIYASEVDFKPQGSGVTIDVEASSSVSVTGQRMDTIMGPQLVRAGLASNVPHITTRNHFKMEDGDVERRSLFTADQYGAVEFSSDKIPGQSPSPAPYDGTGSTPDLLSVFVHGIWVEAKSAAGTFETARNAFQHQISRAKSRNFLDSNADHHLIGYSWDSDIAPGNVRNGAGWLEANKIATLNGPKLGNFIREYKAINSNTHIHLVAHSLGARVVFEALKYLDENGFNHGNKGAIVDTVSLLGGAVRTSHVELGKYYSPIEKAARRTYNYYYTNDQVLKWLFGIGETLFSPDEPWVPRILFLKPSVALIGFVVTNPIGLNGCDGAVPGNYVDDEISLTVTGTSSIEQAIDSHTSYYEKNDGCIENVAFALAKHYTNSQ